MNLDRARNITRDKTSAQTARAARGLRFKKDGRSISSPVLMMPYCSNCGRPVEETHLFCSNCGTPVGQQPQTGQSAAPPYGPYRRMGTGRYGGQRERLRDVITQFRQKGATTPEKVMTAEELGLSPMFKEAMKRRLGQTGIFVETNGRYYLNEKRLEETRTQLTSRRRYRTW